MAREGLTVIAYFDNFGKMVPRNFTARRGTGHSLAMVHWAVLPRWFTGPLRPAGTIALSAEGDAFELCCNPVEGDLSRG
jgi:hypothetical protein